MKVKINGISLNCELTGSGDTLVMTHGLGGNMEGMREHVAAFSGHYRVLLWDQRGCGGSDWADAYHPLSLHAKDLSLLLKSLRVMEAHILGVSWGGILVQRFALDCPEMVKSLTLVSTSSVVNAQAAVNYRTRANSVERAGYDALTRGLEGFVPAFPGNEDMRRPEPQRASTTDPKAYAGQSYSLADLYEHPMTPELARIKCPTLVIGGAKDATAGAAGSVIIHRNIPGSKLHILEDAGHNVPGEKPQWFHFTVLEFLKTVAEAR